MRLSELLERAVTDSLVTVVSAPAGFGKTLALDGWRAATSLPTVAVMARAAMDAADLARRVDEALGDLPDQGGLRVLVIDDAHLIDRPELRSLVERLHAEAAAGLRVVLCGRHGPAVPLQRVGLDGQVALVTSEDLAFTVDEIVDLGAEVGHPLAPADALQVHTATGGWPVAVRCELAARARPGRDPADLRLPLSLTDYVVEEVLDQIPAELAEFVLTATACDELDAELAVALWGDPAGARLLREGGDAGLFLDRRERHDGAARYRWHPAFAARCRAVLRDRDPVVAREVARRGAALVAATDPLDAMRLALSAGEPEVAVRVLDEQWLRVLLEGKSTALEERCASLPLPWGDRPEVLLVRACCRRVAGDDLESSRLRDRAGERAARAEGGDRERFAVLLAYADLLLADGVEDVTRTCDHVQSLEPDAVVLPPAIRCCGEFLVAWAEMRLRRDVRRSMALLRDVSTLCRTEGLDWISRRATAYLAIVLAYAGDFDGALALRPSSVDPRDHLDTETAGIDGALWLAHGFVHHWRNELDQARAALEMALVALDEPPADGSLAIIYLALTAAATGDRKELAQAQERLRSLAGPEAFGVPWGVYQQLAEAAIAESRGQSDVALEIARTTPAGPHTPVVSMQLAGILLRGGDAEGARRRLAEIPATVPQPYLRTGVAVLEALLAVGAGRLDAAHAALERALDHAEPQQVRRCFAEHARDLRGLLGEHAAWGTAHEALVVALLALPELEESAEPTLVGALSPRELDVLRHMRTRMTADEIAAALYVSVNTVKTHQRAIYRKLGASGRRDALRIALASGIS